jgi:hypothetical protein
MTKVFGSRFLEPVQKSKAAPPSDWSWRPASPLSKIYGSGNNTQSRMSTYAAEKDNRDDDDRPNEGLAA